jgi:ubiquinone/menaquinone biosynthesis C-methylase UbiE
MTYSSERVKKRYNKIAREEDRCEKELDLRIELPREFIKKYIRRNDNVLDAGGGTGINSIMMAGMCKSVILLDIAPGILAFAEENINRSGRGRNISIEQGDIVDLSRFKNSQFSLVISVGDAISYVLERRFKAMKELVRVAKKGAIIIIGCDSKYGFIGSRLREGRLDEAIKIQRTGNCLDDWASIPTHLYTVNEMIELLMKNDCKIIEVASTPTFSETFDYGLFREKRGWNKLKKLEMDLCTCPELLGIGDHLLFVAKKE